MTHFTFNCISSYNIIYSNIYSILTLYNNSRLSPSKAHANYIPTIADLIALLEYGAPSGVCVYPSLCKSISIALLAISRLSETLIQYCIARYSHSSLLSQSDTFQWFQFLCPLYVAIVYLLVTNPNKHQSSFLGGVHTNEHNLRRFFTH